MASGVPVVASNAGGIPGGGGGRRQRAPGRVGDVEAMAEAGISILSDNQKWVRMSVAAQQVAIGALRRRTSSSPSTSATTSGCWRAPPAGRRAAARRRGRRLMPLPSSASRLIDAALAEDVGPGDFTTLWTVPEERRAEARIVAKASGVIAGSEVAVEVFRRVDPVAGGDGGRGGRDGGGARRPGDDHSRLRAVHPDGGADGAQLHAAPVRRGHGHAALRAGGARAPARG